MDKILDLIAILLLACIPATLSFFLDYCFGKPMSDEPKPKEIFSFIPLYFAKRRIPDLKQREIVAFYAEQLNSPDLTVRKQYKELLDRTLMIQGAQLFTWEKVFLCPFCSNFWLSLLVTIILYFTVHLLFINPIFLFILIPTFSHSILRKL